MYSNIKAHLKRHYLGLGGAGGNILDALIKKGIAKNYTYINSEESQSSDNKNFILIDLPKQNPWLPSLVDIELPLSLSNLVGFKKHYVLCVGLGGDTGSNLALAISNLLYRHKASFEIICYMPFSFESFRITFAELIFRNLKQKAKVTCFDNAKLFRSNGHLSFREGFALIENEVVLYCMH